MTRSTRQHATIVFVRGALIAICVLMIAGVLSVLHYLPSVSSFLAGAGFDFAAMRPIHTTFASAWIFLAAIAMVYHYLQNTGEPATSSERWMLRAQVIIWGLAGLGILATLFVGVTSGR